MRRPLKFSTLRFRLVSFFFIKKRVMRFKRPKWRFLKKTLQFLSSQMKFYSTGIPRLKIRTRRGRLVFPFFNRGRLLENYIKFNVNKVPYVERFPEKAFQILSTFFTQPVFISRCYSRWVKAKGLFRDEVQMKRRFFFYYDFGYTLSFFKKKIKLQKSRYYKFNILFIKPEFRIDVLLWRLHFFPSLFAARHALFSGFILLNFKKISKFVFLKSGDILKFNRIKYSFQDHIARYFSFFLVPSFVEVDYYLNALICIYSADSIQQQDFISIKRNSCNFSRINCYLSAR